jgi:XTP/dITP diphosphohydrolase
MPILLIATNNPGKVAEFRDLLADCGWEVVSPPEIGLKLDVAETGTTYSENARIKAVAFSSASGFAALADDSGLEVDALDGQPGPLHHEHGWDGRDDPERIRILVEALKDVPPEKRTARYRAVLVLSLPSGLTAEEEGIEEGLIVDTPAGYGGFGYDPIFYLPELGKTVAELTMDEKNRISHRALAAFKMRDRLRRMTGPAVPF